MGQRCCKDCLGGGSDSDDDLNPHHHHHHGGAYHNLDEHGCHHHQHYGGHATDNSSMHHVPSASTVNSHSDGHDGGRGRRLRPSESWESVHTNDSHGTAPCGADGQPPPPLAKKRSFWDTLRTPRWGRTKSCDTKAVPIAPPKRPSGHEMLERTQVVCLLGSGAFGTVSLVIHRAPGTSSHNAPVVPALTHSQSQHLAPPPGSSPAAGQTSGTVTPPMESPTQLNRSQHLSPLDLPPSAPPTHNTGSGQASGRHTPDADDSASPASAGATPQAGQPRHRPPLRRVFSAESVTSSAAGSFAGAAVGAPQQSFAGVPTVGAPQRRLRFAVLKRIGKNLKANVQGTTLDIAAERFRSAGLKHPFVMRLLEASQTKGDYYNVYPFALGGDLGRMITRQISEVVQDAGTMATGNNVAALTKAVRIRALEPRASPTRCTCSRSSSAAGGASVTVDRLCPVARWSATEGGLPLATTGLVAFEILSALQFLATHPNRITHGDLKPDNVFIMENGHLLLGDFSLMTAGVLPPPPSDSEASPMKKKPSGLNRSFASFFGQSTTTTSAGAAGTTTSTAAASSSTLGSRGSPPGSPSVGGATREVERNPRYMPPEVVMGAWKPLIDGPPVEPVLDMWSLGVMLLEVATGVHPFFPPGTPLQSQPAMMALVQGIFEPIPCPSRPVVAQLPPTATSDEKAAAERDAEAVFDGICEFVDLLNDFIRKCLTRDPTRRLSPSDAQQHALFRHPLLLCHLGIDPVDPAVDAAALLANSGHYESVEDAEKAFVVSQPSSSMRVVDWQALDDNALLAQAFQCAVWDRVNLEQLTPHVVPRDTCYKGGMWLPDSVNLGLNGGDLLASFCTASGLVTGNPSFADYTGFSMTVGSAGQPHSHQPPPGHSRNGSDSVSPAMPHHQQQQTPLVSPPARIVHRKTDSGGAGAAAVGASPAGDDHALLPPQHESGAASSTARSPTGAAPARGDEREFTNFGDERLPPFCPVDLRFFASTQVEFDGWTDDNNKGRLARTDAEIRAEADAAANLQQYLADEESSRQGRSGGAAASGARMSPEFLANYTYRGFESSLFR